MNSIYMKMQVIIEFTLISILYKQKIGSNTVLVRKSVKIICFISISKVIFNYLTIATQFAHELF